MPPDRRRMCERVCVSLSLFVLVCISFIFVSTQSVELSWVGAVGMFYFIVQFNVGSASVKTHILRSTLFRWISSDRFKNTLRLLSVWCKRWIIRGHTDNIHIYITMRYTQHEFSYTYFAAITNQKINIRNENIFNFIRGVCSILFHRNEYLVRRQFFSLLFNNVVAVLHFWLIELRCTFSWHP